MSQLLTAITGCLDMETASGIKPQANAVLPPLVFPDIQLQGSAFLACAAYAINSVQKTVRYV
ncbi:MAG: hypothetical protein ISS66_16685 [Desulfobacteraceae bacterium]|nr:hypothetical protein [Desulfobacteraceae bacterium]